MIDVEALKRFLLLSGLLFTAVGWWRAEVHNAQLAESAVGFRDLAQTCVDTSLSRLDDIESKQRELVDALRVGGSEAVAEKDRQMNGLGLAVVILALAVLIAAGRPPTTMIGRARR